MLTGNAESFQQKSRLAISLSWVGGYTNVVTLMSCGWVSSHMTGPTTWFGRVIVEGRGAGGSTSQGALFFGWVILAFWLGAVASTVMIEGAERRDSASKYVLPVALEAILLSLFAIGLNLNGSEEIVRERPLFVMTGLACFAMGLQNATITRISGAVVRTTHVTGVVTDLGIETVRYAYWLFEKTRGKGFRRRGRVLKVAHRHPSALRLALLGSIFGSFLFGVAAGTFIYLHFFREVMWAPIGFLVFIFFQSWIKKKARGISPR